MVKKLAALGLILAFALGQVASAQEQRQASYAYQYDLDSTNLTFCVVKGLNGSPFGGNIPGSGTVSSVGTAVEASSTTAFQGLGAGDIFYAVQSQGLTILQIASVTDGDSLVLVTAPGSDFTGVAWSWRDLVCGTTDADGWIDVANMDGKTITIQYEQGDGNIDVRWECRKSYLGAKPLVVFPSQTTDTCGTNGTLTAGHCRYTAANVGIANRISLVVWEPYKDCRVGVKLTGADASDVGANLEQITIGLEEVFRR